MSISDVLPAGKLPPPMLDRLLRRFAPSDPRLIVGPQMGEDAAVIDFGATYLVAKTDPITFATGEIGWYAVNVNANDIAVMGGCLLYTSPSPRDRTRSRMPSSA